MILLAPPKILSTVCLAIREDRLALCMDYSSEVAKYGSVTMLGKFLKQGGKMLVQQPVSQPCTDFLGLGTPNELR